jgi:hypothetical protein
MSKISRTSKPASKSGKPKVLGTTKDGVKIRQAKGRSKHFTAKDARKAVATAKAQRT